MNPFASRIQKMAQIRPTCTDANHCQNVGTRFSQMGLSQLPSGASFVRAREVAREKGVY